MYPELVLKVVSLDRFGRRMRPPNETIPVKMRNALTNFMALSEKKEHGPATSPLTYEQARNKVLNNYQNSQWEPKHADILLVRGLKRRSDQDEWEFTRDLRSIYTPLYFSNFTTEQLKAIARGITCPYLIVTGKKSATPFEPREVLGEIYDIHRARSEDFRLVEVDGPHHVHLTKPDLVAPHIYNFLLPFKSKL